MLVAFLIALFATLLAYISGKTNSISYLKFAFILVTIFLLLGHNWGNDVVHYEDSYNQINSYNASVLDFSSLYGLWRGDQEYGWTIINLLANPIGFWGLRIVYFGITNYLLYNIVRRNIPSKWYWLALFLYTFNPNFMVLSSSMMRQWLSMIIILGSITLVDSQIKYRLPFQAGAIILASTFHQSALIALPMLLYNFSRFNIKSLHFIFIIPLFVVYWFFSQKFLVDLVEFITIKNDGLYSAHINNRSNNISMGIVMVFKLGLSGLFLWRIKDLDIIYRRYVLLFITSFLFFPMIVISQMVDRLGYYYGMFEIIAYPILLCKLKIDNNIRNIILIVICFITIYNFNLFFNSPVWHADYYKYHTIFETF